MSNPKVRVEGGYSAEDFVYLAPELSNWTGKTVSGSSNGVTVKATIQDSTPEEVVSALRKSGRDPDKYTITEV